MTALRRPGEVVTIMYPSLFSARAETRLRQVAPGIEVQTVPYCEPTALRIARVGGQVADCDLATAPDLSAASWQLLERTTVAVALDLPTGMLDRAPSLAWVQAIGAGVEHFDTAGLAAHGVVLTNASGLSASSIAEFVFARLLQVWKHVRELDDRQRRAEWAPLHGQRVAGRTMGIVGLGSIGRTIAQRARAFEMRVLANRRRALPGDVDPDVDELFTLDGLDEMIACSDAVVVCAPATPDTQHLFNARRIGLMKPGAVLCNIARGSLVDDDAVVAALYSGHLGAAILDVTSVEPLPPASPLWTAPNCYLSPHTSTALDGYGDALLELTTRNLARWVRDEPLENVVGNL